MPTLAVGILFLAPLKPSSKKSTAN